MRHAFATVLSWILMLGAASAQQAFPARPISLVVASAPGGGVDVLARQLADGLGGTLGQSVVVQNKASIVGHQSVIASPADGYTLLFDASTLAMLPYLMKSPPFNAGTDFTPITLYARVPYVLAVHPSLGIRSLRELIAYGKANPGKPAWGVAGVGTPDRIAAAQLAQAAGIAPLVVPYRGGGPALAGLLAGDVHAVMLPAGSLRGAIETGKVVALGTSGVKPNAELGNLQPIASVVPNYSFYSWYGLWGPKGLPASVVRQVRDATVKAASQKEFADRVARNGYELILSETAEFIDYMKAQLAHNEALIGSLNIKE